MRSIGMATRSALVRHSERGLGVRNRPREAREIVHAIDPTQQTQRCASDGDIERKTYDITGLAVMVIILGAMVMAQYLQGAMQ